ncbi:hypothetical protein SUVZ_15G1340 [Saccharomyces uvarum]|uniref:t-SNARE coiled-coil homology domain-containing protein n=1 Tax=Saccharomyces uvarum TaxID=230603 RepID=A0ABN8WL69_SACUV|nr:hypothetical protein SUVZ_15G1340 [Saccharomyces uvarum]
MFRDRTNLFLSYRRTFPHNITIPSGKAPLSDDRDIEMGSYPMADMSHDISARLMDGQDSKRGSSGDALPPIFIDIAQDVDDYLLEVRRLSEQLAKVYRKNSLPGFEDKSHDEALIEDLSFKVIQMLQRCYGVMKRLKTIFNSQFVDGKQLSREELIILDNLQKTYAEKIQTESNKFRVLQNNYLKFLNKDDLKPIRNNKLNTEDTLLLDEEEEAAREKREGLDIEDYSKRTLQRQQQLHDTSAEAYLRERDEEITQLARGVLEVSTIFREMQDLVIDQGTIVDRIDYNLENTVVELKSADKELNKATHYQKRTQKCKVILLLALCVITLFFFVMLKPHGSGGGGGGRHGNNNSNNNNNNSNNNENNGGSGSNSNNSEENNEVPSTIEVTEPENRAPIHIL